MSPASHKDIVYNHNKTKQSKRNVIFHEVYFMCYMLLKYNIAIKMLTPKDPPRQLQSHHVSGIYQWAHAFTYAVDTHLIH